MIQTHNMSASPGWKVFTTDPSNGWDWSAWGPNWGIHGIAPTKAEALAAAQRAFGEFN